jgi:predicted CXXCH cytochrome family protein
VGEPKFTDFLNLDPPIVAKIVKEGSPVMFKRIVGLLALTAMGMFLSGVVSAQTIVGSVHDFSTAGDFNSGGELCIVCHTPHESDTSVSLAPLWNHALTTKADFTLYAGVDLQGTITQPDGISKLCLSCHDGTVALDSFGGTDGTSFIDTAFPGVGAGIIDGDLNSEHPISITYETGGGTVLDSGMNDSSTFAANGVSLFGGKVECASCHNVHNESGETNLLVMSNVGSDMCLECHDK